MTDEDVKLRNSISEKYPQTVNELIKLLEDEMGLFCKKQNDYGTNNVTKGQDLNTEDGKRVALAALIFRIDDKVQRLVNLVIKNPNSSALNESITDSFIDISLLAKIALIVDSGKWAK
jgi:hypothetical protein